MRVFRRRLMEWFDEKARDLPWRRTRDPYRIWVSEIMLQQTRVAAVIPYYERFLERFPDVRALASAEESEVLALWSGLGYYSRARNLLRAARMIHESERFPRSYEELRALPGVGVYTAAAIASIAFGEPRAVVDGNVRRVLSRLSCGAEDPAGLAQRLLDRQRPGDFNQALMELGAEVCQPRSPRCDVCPVERYCQARKQGRQSEFPERRPRPPRQRLRLTLALVSRRGGILFVQENGFWNLPQLGGLTGFDKGREVGRFRHSILNRDYEVTVVEGKLGEAPAGSRNLRPQEWARLPLATLARKALAIWLRKAGPETH
ncbi:MAG: A/G-specific adenine glycosylase [Bryobacteraceae bacterium]|nr:A/G-specific adenine glycosylase [Bryobacteraceae bacterium]